MQTDKFVIGTQERSACQEHWKNLADNLSERLRDVTERKVFINYLLNTLRVSFGELFIFLNFKKFHRVNWRERYLDFIKENTCLRHLIICP